VEIPSRGRFGIGWLLAAPKKILISDWPATEGRRTWQQNPSDHRTTGLHTILGHFPACQSLDNEFAKNYLDVVALLALASSRLQTRPRQCFSSSGPHLLPTIASMVPVQ
jgi:hypothetical protein